MKKADMEKELGERATNLMQEFVTWFANVNEIDNLNDILVIGKILKECAQLLEERGT